LFLVSASTCDNVSSLNTVSGPFMCFGRLRIILLLCLLVLSVSSVTAQRAAAPANTPKQTISVPVIFELNQGQAHEPYRFIARNTGGNARFTDAGPDFLMGSAERKAVIQFRPVGVTSKTRAEGKLPLDGRANYFFGRDSSQWLENVPTFGRVAYSEIFPGVDLLFYGNHDRLEHDFIVSPHADPAKIRFALTGAEDILLTSSGDLVAAAAGAKLLLQKPVAYQTIDGRKVPIESSFRIDQSQTISFEVGHYDRDRELIIDPTLTFSTYLDGTHNDIAAAIATDSSGNIYIAGNTQSPDYTLVGPLRSTCSGCADGGTYGYISKLDPTGHTLLYSTYFGGSGDSEIDAIAIDSSGNLVATGYTSTIDIPKAGNGPLWLVPGVFAFSLDPTGSTLNYSGIIGTTTSGYQGYELNYQYHGFALAVDGSSNVYIAGTTGADNGAPEFPVTAGTYGSGATSFGNAIFAVKLAPDGSQIYGTVIPSTSPTNSSYTYVGGIAIDPQGDLYVSGMTAADLPATPGALVSTFPNAYPDDGGFAGFLLELNPTASNLVFATYLPGTDRAGPVVRAADGSLYITGNTSETNLPVSSNALQKTLSPGCSCNNGYILHLNAAGTQVLGATYLSGTIPFSNEGTGFGSIALDNAGDVFVGGNTSSVDFPLVNPVVSYFDETGNNTDVVTVLAGLTPDLSQEVFGSYFNGNGAGAQLSAMTLDSNGHLLFAGGTFSDTNFITTANAYQPNAPASPSSSVAYEHQYVASVDLTVPAPSACFDTRGAVFANTPANTTSYTTIHLTNCGNAPMTIESMTSSSPLVAISQPCSTIAAGSTCTLQFSYTPIDSTAFASTITMTANTVIPTQTLSLSGQGVAPKLTIDGNPALGQALVGGSLPIKTSLLIRNAGNASLTISSVSITPGDFSITSSNCTATIGSQLACIIGISFSPTAAGMRSAALTIDSNDPVNPQTVANLSGTGVATYPVPVLTSLSSQTQIVSTTSISVELTGSNFFPQSVVFINGIAVPTTFSSNTSLDATAPASSLGSIGELSVTVYNPGPGGGESLPQILTIYQVLSIGPQFLVSVPAQGLLYAAIPASAATNPNTVIPINPATGALGSPIPVGNNPTILAASGDGKYLYVTLAADQTVQRINLQTQAVERTFPYPPNLSCSSCSIPPAVDLQAVPGNSQEVVLSQGSSLSLYNDSGLVNSVPDPPVSTSEPAFDSIAFAGNPQSIYALPFTLVQDPFFTTATLDAAGLHYVPLTGGNYGGNNTTGGGVVSDGTLLYTTAGEVWNPATGEETGTFPVTIYDSTTSSQNEGNLTLDTTLGEIYEIGIQNYGSDSSAQTLTAYGLNSLSITGTLAFPQINTETGTNLVRWGSNGFAFLGLQGSNNNLYLVRSSIASPQDVNAAPILATLLPASATAGGAGFTLTLNGTNFLPSSTVIWNGTALAVTYINSTQLTVPVPASALAASGAAGVTVTNPGPGGGSSSLAFAIVPPVTAPMTSVVTLTSSANPVLVQNPVTFTASVSTSATGTISFVDGVTPLGSAAIANGIASYTTSSLAAGSHSITAIYSGDANFSTATSNALSEVVEDFALGAVSSASPSQTASPGAAATFSLSISPSGATFPSPVTFSVSGLPSGATATFTPPTIPAGAGTTSVILTVQLPTNGASLARQRIGRGIAPLTLALLLLPFTRRSRAPSKKFSRALSLTLVLYAAFVPAAILGCGGGNGASTVSPSTANYTLTVTATSGSVSHTTSLTLIVQ
jgi:Bacterial Ig-like domain (group 3)/Protein of unknown function (DUF1573)/Beta-propeller repeat